MRVGILTGGGDCPGLNAVIRAVAKSLILHHGAEVVGFEDGFMGMIERRSRPLGYRDVSGILGEGGTILGTHNKANPLSYFGANGDDVSDEVKDYYDDLGLDGVVVIGGDGTMSISHGLQQKGINIVGVPKTIDNDLMATEAVDRLQTTGQSHGRVMILETMGRYAGWIALEAAVAGGADIVLIPEVPYEIEAVLETCRRREARQRFTVIVVAEGAKPKGGTMTVRDVVEDSPDPLRLGGVGQVLQHALEQHLDSEIRTTVLGHVQRGGTPTHFDRVLASKYGAYAAELVSKGRWDRMVALQGGELTSVPLVEVANKVRCVPLTDPLVASALAVGMSFGAEVVCPDMVRPGE